MLHPREGRVQGAHVPSPRGQLVEPREGRADLHELAILEVRRGAGHEPLDGVRHRLQELTEDRLGRLAHASTVEAVQGELPEQRRLVGRVDLEGVPVQPARGPLAGRLDLALALEVEVGELDQHVGLLPRAGARGPVGRHQGPGGRLQHPDPPLALRPGQQPRPVGSVGVRGGAATGHALGPRAVSHSVADGGQEPGVLGAFARDQERLTAGELLKDREHLRGSTGAEEHLGQEVPRRAALLVRLGQLHGLGGGSLRAPELAAIEPNPPADRQGQRILVVLIEQVVRDLEGVREPAAAAEQVGLGSLGRDQRREVLVLEHRRRGGGGQRGGDRGGRRERPEERREAQPQAQRSRTSDHVREDRMLSRSVQPRDRRIRPDCQTSFNCPRGSAPRR